MYHVILATHVIRVSQAATYKNDKNSIAKQLQSEISFAKQAASR